MPKVPFLKESRIEDETLCVLAEYARKYGTVTAPPVPVEEILEVLLGLDIDFDDLEQMLGMDGVLGATWFEDKRVVVDTSLDPTVDSSKEGRYRFTVAHEIGHWQFHRHLFVRNPAQGSLFGGDNQPSIVCRAKSRKEPAEWQADRFSGFLLMPKEMVLRTWEARYGGLEPYVAAEEIADLSAKWGLAEDERPTVAVAREFAREFHVSGQAMQIRLIGLGLITPETQEPDLFSI